MKGFVEHLREMAGRDKNAIISEVQNIIAHLLYRDYAPGEATHRQTDDHWQGELQTFRQHVHRLLKANTGFWPWFRGLRLGASYQLAITSIDRKFPGTKEALRKLYKDCPYTLEDIAGPEIWSEIGTKPKAPPKKRKGGS